MPDVIWVAVITGIFGVISAFIAAYAATSKSTGEMRVNQAVTDTKIDALANEVREHNNFARRIPVIENKIEALDSRVKVLERKVE